jgi:hypothetical protein
MNDKYDPNCGYSDLEWEKLPSVFNEVLEDWWQEAALKTQG